VVLVYNFQDPLIFLVRKWVKKLTRLIGDVTFYRYITHDDLEKILEAIFVTHTIDEIEPF
jgi:hypothetical protein